MAAATGTPTIRLRKKTENKMSLTAEVSSKTKPRGNPATYTTSAVPAMKASHLICWRSSPADRRNLRTRATTAAIEPRRAETTPMAKTTARTPLSGLIPRGFWMRMPRSFQGPFRAPDRRPNPIE